MQEIVQVEYICVNTIFRSGEYKEEEGLMILMGFWNISTF